MADSNKIFRQAALDRLASPEQLDQLMRVTTPKSWLALAACGLLLLIAVVWGIWGTLRITVNGRGILIKHGGVFVASAFGDGRVSDILVTEEQTVTNEQLLGRLEVPGLKMKIVQAGIAQSNLESQLDQLKNFQKEDRATESSYQEQAVQTYHSISNDYVAQAAAVEDRLAGLRELSSMATGMVAKPTLLAVSNELFAARQGVKLTGVQIKQVEINRLQAEERRRQALQDKQALVEQGRQNLEYLTRLYQLTSEIRSPFDGTVLEITVKSNQLINANMPVMSLQSTKERLEAWLFLSAGAGKRVATNMDVHLALVSAKKEDFGMILGKVASVSPLPATPQLMLRVLENPTLVTQFSQEGAPFYAVVNLLTNADGYLWTTRKGPELRPTSGTLCEGTVTVTNRSPISLVLPLLKYSAGL